MASEYTRLMDLSNLAASMVQDRNEVFDAGAYTSLFAHCRIAKAGTAGNVLLQHAMVNESDAYINLTGVTWALNGNGGLIVAVNAHMRYIRWITDGGVTGTPVALIDLIGKE